MLNGQIIPVVRRVVEFGQPCLNGDIVRMPDTTRASDIQDESDMMDIPPYCGECGTCHTKTMMCDDSNQRWYGTLTEPIRIRQRSRCYSCKTGTGRMRRVTGHFVTSKAFDPTHAYRLTCGHTSID